MNFFTWSGRRCFAYVPEHFSCTDSGQRAGKKKIIMRINLTFAVLITAFLQIAMAADAQNVTFSKQNASLEEVLKEIHQQTGYDFLYADGMMRETKTVTINFKDTPFEKVLQICFKDQPLTYTLNKKTVVIRRRPAEVKDNELLPVQNEQLLIITGTVSNSNGDPLPGASVNLKGSSVGTTTNDQGKFTIDVPNGSGILVFSFVGFAPQEIAIKGRSVINVSLSEDTKSLNQIVIVGYGTQKKANLTGAVDMVTSKRLENRPIVDAGQGLEGLIPNLNVKPPNGDPTAAAEYNN